MTFRRFVAILGFCFMLVSAALLAQVFFLLWLHESDRLVLYIDQFHERTIELWLVFLGFCLIPITIYEFDALLRQ